MKNETYELIRTALENNHFTFNVQGWPAAVLGIGVSICGTITVLGLKALEVSAAEVASDSQQNNWPKAA